MQSSLESQQTLHVAIIMDGNGRWAAARGLPRTAGHRAGIESLRRVCEAAPPLGVTMLTVYAFSSDNWQRPPAEVRGLMSLLRHYMRSEAAKLKDAGIRLTVIGRRDRLPVDLAAEIADAEADTAHGRSLHLRIAFDYSARDAIIRAAAQYAHGSEMTRESFGQMVSGEAAGERADVDLLIRSGGEKRLSDFLLWECAYAELYFTDQMWPDFTGDDLAAAVAEFHRRERRFGRAVAAQNAPAQVPSAA
jgi:undecaprenyl diphosphate synthase